MSIFGTIFRVSTFGESHGRGVGCIIDNVPPNLPLDTSIIQNQLNRRRPGQSSITTARKEADTVEIWSGTQNNFTLGTPLMLLVRNQDMRPKDYQSTANAPRPGHADYTYQIKYGIRAQSGGGRSSARETIARVASGAVAEHWLHLKFGTEIVACVAQVGDITVPEDELKIWQTGCITHPVEQAMQSQSSTRKLSSSSSDDDNNSDSIIKLTREIVDTAGTVCLIQLDESTKKKLISFQNTELGKEMKQQINEQLYLDAFGFLYNSDGVCVAYSADYGAFGTPTRIPCLSSKVNKSLLPCVSLTSDNLIDVVNVRCPHIPTACKMVTKIHQVKQANDSIGGIIFCVSTRVPVGLGEPCFDKLEAGLAHAMLSLPATKGFDIGSGFEGVSMLGSKHNDPFVAIDTPVSHKDTAMPIDQNNTSSNNASCLKVLGTSTNHSGGTLGGISNGSPLYFRVAIKSVSTIGLMQQTASWDGMNSYQLQAKGRHDSCVLPRAPPLIEAMTALVLTDNAMMQIARVGASLDPINHMDTVKTETSLDTTTSLIPAPIPDVSCKNGILSTGPAIFSLDPHCFQSNVKIMDSNQPSKRHCIKTKSG